jgi:hypothetical protein
MSFIKLQKRIEEELGIKLINFERCYHGYWQRSNGAWSWRAIKEGDIYDYGSPFNAKDLLSEKELTIYSSPSGGEILPK